MEKQNFSVALTSQERAILERLARQAGRLSCGAYVRALIVEDLQRRGNMPHPTTDTGPNATRAEAMTNG